MKKNKGFSVIEVIVATLLFGVTIIPLVKFNSYLLTSYRKNVILEKKIKNIETIFLQLESIPFETFISYVGTHSYNNDNFSRDNFTSYLSLLYPEVELKNLTFIITATSLATSNKKIDCIRIDILYSLGKREIKFTKYKF